MYVGRTSRKYKDYLGKMLLVLVDGNMEGAGVGAKDRSRCHADRREGRWQVTDERLKSRVRCLMQVGMVIGEEVHGIREYGSSSDLMIRHIWFLVDLTPYFSFQVRVAKDGSVSVDGRLLESNHERWSTHVEPCAVCEVMS